MSRIIAIALVLIVLPALVLAGAWPREGGEVFLSLKAGQASRAERSYSLYSEFGATPRLTLGLNADRYTQRTGQVDLFGRFALRPGKPLQVSTEVSAGYALDPRPMSLPVMADRLGFGWALLIGRGFGTPLGDAWADVRIGRESALDQVRQTTEAKLTAGIAPTDRIKLFVDVEHESGVEDFTSISPNIALRVLDGTHATLGYTADTRETVGDRVDLGVWLAF